MRVLQVAESDVNLVFLAPIAINFAAGARTAIHALVAGMFLRLHGIVVIANAAGTIVFESDAVAISGVIPIAANGGFVIPFNPDPRGCLVTAAAGEALNITTVTCTLDGYAIVSQATI